MSVKGTIIVALVGGFLVSAILGIGVFAEEQKNLSLNAPSSINQNIQFQKLFDGDLSVNIGELFVLDRLFRNSSQILNSDRTTLGDLFILQQLFQEEGNTIFRK